MNGKFIELIEANPSEKPLLSRTFLNFFSYLKVRNSLSDLEYFDSIGIDGQLLVLYLRMWGIKTKRASFDFTSLANQVFLSLELSQKTIYIVGARDEEVCGFVNKIQTKYPNLKIVGYRNGYFTKEETDAFTEYLAVKCPDFILVGMGSPFQEQFSARLRKAGCNSIINTCGGFIHQTARGDSISYYPEVIDHLHLRWLYRIYDEPKLLQRYLVYYPMSVVILTYDLLCMKFFMRE